MGLHDVHAVPLPSINTAFKVKETGRTELFQRKFLSPWGLRRIPSAESEQRLMFLSVVEPMQADIKSEQCHQRHLGVKV